MEDLSTFCIKGITCPMVFVPPGNFQFQGKKEIHFEKGFYIGKYLVTQALWELVMENNPSSFKGKDFPIESISWDNICQPKGFLERLNALEEVKHINRQDGLQFQLPSETMWEYAAKGGKGSKGFPYAGGHKLKEVGWYNANSYRETKPVGLKLPNELSLYDMSGNVWEWCADYYDKDYQNAPDDGSALLKGVMFPIRVVRGGAWDDKGLYCRVSHRFRNLSSFGFENNIFGFRLARY